MVPKMNAARASQVAWATSAAMAEFKDEKKAKRAGEAYGHCADYARSMPIGWLPTNTHEQFAAKMENHVKSKMGPTGFIGITFGWLFLAILSGLISWAVQRFMNNNYGPK
jgi:hypothetical protein